MVLLRRWWPITVLFACGLLAQNIFASRYNVSGHAAEHLESAGAPFAGLAIVLILLFVTPLARRQLVVLIAGAAWWAATVLVLVGNIRVVDALVRAGLGHTPTDDLMQDAKIASAHDLANLAPWLGVVTSLALIGALFRYRHISARVAIGAAVISVVFPPWIIPGAGVVVVAVARCVAYHRAARLSRSD
jgi:hypothetical protein